MNVFPFNLTIQDEDELAIVMDALRNYRKLVTDVLIDKYRLPVLKAIDSLQEQLDVFAQDLAVPD